MSSPRERGRVMSYTIEATGQTGWLAYRYQYKTANNEYFGYAETEAEAMEAIQRAGVSAQWH
jgi:hypothetical protein